MPSDSKKKRDAKKKEAAKKRDVKKPTTSDADSAAKLTDGDTEEQTDQNCNGADEGYINRLLWPVLSARVIPQNSYSKIRENWELFLG